MAVVEGKLMVVELLAALVEVCGEGGLIGFV